LSETWDAVHTMTGHGSGSPPGPAISRSWRIVRLTRGLGFSSQGFLAEVARSWTGSRTQPARSLPRSSAIVVACFGPPGIKYEAGWGRRPHGGRRAGGPGLCTSASTVAGWSCGTASIAARPSARPLDCAVDWPGPKPSGSWPARKGGYRRPLHGPPLAEFGFLPRSIMPWPREKVCSSPIGRSAGSRNWTSHVVRASLLVLTPEPWMVR
jgi:hypothetical protein